MLTLPAGTKKSDVLEAMDKHIISKTKLMGKYKKK
jgi:phosphatidylethanolamine-binding protein (PEBP) family uncharacterized protein